MKYPILLVWHEADGLWVADVPDIRWCSAHGETPGIALRNVTEALADIVADARQRGLALPPPTDRPTFARAS